MSTFIKKIRTNGWHRRAERRRSKRDFAGVVRCVSSAASAGITDAQLELALLYQSGMGVPRSLGTAAYWLEKAAAGGNVDAMVRLAKLGLVGIAPAASLFEESGTSNLRRSLSWARRAAALGSPEGKAVLALTLEYEGNASPAEIARLLEEGASAQDPSACFQLGVKLLRSDDQDVDRERVVSLIKIAARRGLPQASYLYGVIKEVGFGCAKDDNHASSLYEKSSAAGSIFGMARHGAALIASGPRKHDMLVGETWLRRAALAGHGAAASLIGALRAGQDGLPPNFDEAITWFRKAGELNDPFGAKAEALLSYLGYGGPSSQGDVLALLSKSRRLGILPSSDPASLISPGGLPLALAIRASHWFQSQARSGERKAILGLAACKAFGIEGLPDHAGALQCLHSLS